MRARHDWVGPSKRSESRFNWAFGGELRDRFSLDASQFLSINEVRSKIQAWPID
jgi:hypothetical protein